MRELVASQSLQAPRDARFMSNVRPYMRALRISRFARSIMGPT